MSDGLRVGTSGRGPCFDDRVGYRVFDLETDSSGSVCPQRLRGWGPRRDLPRPTLGRSTLRASVGRGRIYGPGGTRAQRLLGVVPDPGSGTRRWRPEGRGLPGLGPSVTDLPQVGVRSRLVVREGRVPTLTPSGHQECLL